MTVDLEEAKSIGVEAIRLRYTYSPEAPAMEQKRFEVGLVVEALAKAGLLRSASRKGDPE